MYIIQSNKLQIIPYPTNCINPLVIPDTAVGKAHVQKTTIKAKNSFIFGQTKKCITE